MARLMHSGESAYSLLTHIQGFDSFSLSPSSTTEEISRAYETQLLIWKPESNPNDPQALRTYKRIKEAYDTLMDPKARAAHDEQLAKAKDIELSNLRGADRRRQETTNKQPPPEDLGAPPPSARPFAYVEQQPSPETPAARAGLGFGDALLMVGDATRLPEVQGRLAASLDTPLAALVYSRGRFLKKWIIPTQWSDAAPSSLLGCLMSEDCPAGALLEAAALLAARATWLGKGGGHLRRRTAGTCS